MRTEWIAVAEGVELAAEVGTLAADADAWTPSATAAPPFVLVHGLASNARMWDGVAASLAASGHPVVTVDRQGHGRSSKLDSPYDVPTVVEVAAAWVEVRDGADGSSWVLAGSPEP